MAFDRRGIGDVALAKPVGEAIDQTRQFRGEGFIGGARRIAGDQGCLAGLHGIAIRRFQQKAVNAIAGVDAVELVFKQSQDMTAVAGGARQADGDSGRTAIGVTGGQPPALCPPRCRLHAGDKPGGQFGQGKANAGNVQSRFRAGHVAAPGGGGAQGIERFLNGPGELVDTQLHAAGIALGAKPPFQGMAGDADNTVGGFQAQPTQQCVALIIQPQGLHRQSGGEGFGLINRVGDHEAFAAITGKGMGRAGGGGEAAQAITDQLFLATKQMGTAADIEQQAEILRDWIWRATVSMEVIGL